MNMDGIPMYAGNSHRLTIDKEWDEEELAGDVSDECIKLVPQLAEKFKDRAMADRDLMKPQYMASKICEENDLIEIYNKEYDRHRNEDIFGIHWFDAWVLAEIKKIASSNLVGDKK